MGQPHRRNSDQAYRIIALTEHSVKLNASSLKESLRVPSSENTVGHNPFSAR